MQFDRFPIDFWHSCCISLFFGEIFPRFRKRLPTAEAASGRTEKNGLRMVPNRRRNAGGGDLNPPASTGPYAIRIR